MVSVKKTLVVISVKDFVTRNNPLILDCKTNPSGPLIDVLKIIFDYGIDIDVYQKSHNSMTPWSQN